ncbi:MAG: phosphotransferase [Candidatus Saccharibacteria bacterium]|nr:phosphotransferase [Candidatus Saccharibacteria bacterium]
MLNTQESQSSLFDERIGLNTNLEDISKQICIKYRLGQFVSNKLIKIGYEDYSYVLTASGGRYCVKIFNRAKSKQEINGYLDTIKKVATSKLRTPRPLFIENDILFHLTYKNVSYNICVFEYIDGQTYFELGRKPSESEIKKIARQTAIINELDIRPNPVYDSWSPLNFKEEYRQKRGYVPNEYKEKFDSLLADFDKIDFIKLPRSFIHGDIVSTNVMVDKDGEIWIIDFTVSGYLPRIIELAILACDICLNRDSKQKTYSNISLLLDEYDRLIPLTDYERQVFSEFYKLTNAMHILQTYFLAGQGKNSKENEYYLAEGKIGYGYSENPSES